MAHPPNSDPTADDEWTDDSIIEDAKHATAHLDVHGDQDETFDGTADGDPLTTLADAALCVEDADMEATYRKRVIDHVARRFDTADATVELIAGTDEEPTRVHIESATLTATVPINQRVGEPNRNAAIVRRKQPTTPGNSIVLLYREPAADAIEQTIAARTTDATTTAVTALLS